MSPTSVPAVKRILLAGLAAIALVAGLFSPAPAAATTVDGAIRPASLVGFSAGNIISDEVFTDSGTMTEAEIQAFFDAKVSRCLGGSDEYGPIVCLKDFRITSVDRPADAYCDGYTGAANESAARIIFRVAQSCGINPQVLIVMLQKEQGLVTHIWPSAWRYDKALGQGCPDDAPCNPAFVGFFHQIYGAARQLQIYMEGRYFTWYAPGKTWNIRYHPNAACGSSPVYIENLATAALYYYTPYQPNAAALAAGYGTGDGCSAYGNRNFYNYFTDWFGPTRLAQFSAGSAAIEGVAVSGQVLRATSSFTPAPTGAPRYQWYRDGQAIAGATGASYALTLEDSGRRIEVDVTASRSGYTDLTSRSAPAAVRALTTDRLSGAAREATAVDVSKQAWPGGAPTVVLAMSLDFADALSASAASGRLSASLLLTPAASLPAVVADELRRLAPTRVILAGGEGVLSAALMAQVRGLVPGASVERISGLDRYATSRAIVEAVGTSPELFLAAGIDFPDALSAAAIGNRTGAPVLLVDGKQSSLPRETLDTVNRAGAASVVIVGGPGVVSTGIENQLRAAGVGVERLYGDNRFLTNLAVNEAYFSPSATRALLATGHDFPDALAATALAGQAGAPLLLSERSCVPPAALAFVAQGATTRVTLVGGPGVLSADGVARLRSC